MDFKLPLFINTSLPVSNDSPKSTPHIKRKKSFSSKKNKSPIVHRVSLDETEKNKYKQNKQDKKWKSNITTKSK